MPYILNKIIKFIYGWRLESIIVCSLLLSLFWTLLNKHVSRRISIITNGIILFIIVISISFFTIANRTIHVEYSINIIPFMSYITSGGSGKETLWLNAFLFLPLGLSLPFLLPDKLKDKPRTTILIACTFSLAIEMIQFIFKLGLCETTDVIMNTLGAALGTISYIAANHKKEKSEP